MDPILHYIIYSLIPPTFFSGIGAKYLYDRQKTILSYKAVHAKERIEYLNGTWLGEVEQTRIKDGKERKYTMTVELKARRRKIKGSISFNSTSNLSEITRLEAEGGFINENLFVINYRPINGKVQFGSITVHYGDDLTMKAAFSGWGPHIGSLLMGQIQLNKQ